MKFKQWFNLVESLNKDSALLVIDTQNDFIDSKFAVPGAKEIIPKVNSLISRARSQGIPVIFTAHGYGAKDPSTLQRPEDRRYCIIGTFGHGFHSDLDTKDSPIFDKKDFSGFGGKNRTKETENLQSHLFKNNIKRVIVVGLSLDYCVAATAIEARRKGFNAAVVLDASKGMYDYTKHDQVISDLKNAGVEILNTI